MSRHSLVRQSYVRRRAIPAMTIDAEIFSCMNNVPFSVIGYWILFFMATLAG
jgi:hypothetical protein